MTIKAFWFWCNCYCGLFRIHAVVCVLLDISDMWRLPFLDALPVLFGLQPGWFCSGFVTLPLTEHTGWVQWWTSGWFSWPPLLLFKQAEKTVSLCLVYSRTSGMDILVYFFGNPFLDTPFCSSNSSVLTILIFASSLLCHGGVLPLAWVVHPIAKHL